ncbi:hypothetical protein HY745_14735 [Candidatus Desantisbacteria bacterium]|nr:hypothetical protein [Candidatus Desantisbacteria bacterium]
MKNDSSDLNSNLIELKEGECNSSATIILKKMREAIRLKHYSYSTEKTYIDWAQRFYDYVLNVKSMMDRALYAVDPVTGLIVACALIHPDKKLSSIDVPFVINRFGEKRFAAGANRDQIKSCEALGLTFEQFVEISLSGMKEISDRLGL